MKKILAIILSVILMLGAFSGCALFGGEEAYYSDAGFSIYMKKGFKESESEGVAQAYIKGNIGIAVRKEPIADLDTLGYEGITLGEYGDLIMELYGYEDSKTEQDEYGNTYAIYRQAVEGENFTYMAYFFKDATDYYTFNFLCPTDKFYDNENDFKLWANSIIFHNEAEEATPEDKPELEQAGTEGTDELANLVTYDVEGLTFKAAAGYEPTEIEDKLGAFISGTSGIVVNREAVEDVVNAGYEGITVEEYTNLVMETYGHDAVAKVDDYGNTYAVYTQAVSEVDFSYVAFYYEDGGYFWTIQFMCLADDLASVEADYHLWASTVIFPG